MSGKDQTRPPRRPQPDRDSFYDQHGKDGGRTVLGASAAAVPPAPSPADTEATAVIEKVVDKAVEKVTGAADTAIIETPVITPVVDEQVATKSGIVETPVIAPAAEAAVTEIDAAETAVIEAPAMKTAANETAVISIPGNKSVEPELAETSVIEKAVTRTDLRTADDVVVTEPFADLDLDDADAEDAEQRRRAAEHLTEEPLPYIEPAPTAALAYGETVDTASASSTVAATSVAAGSGVAAYDVDDDYDDDPARGTLDLGLLVLRVTVGIAFLLHGLQKLTTWEWLHGMGIDGFAIFLSSGNGNDQIIGFNADMAQNLALAGGITETVAGVLLILGLLTPVAGAAALGVIAVAITFRVTLAGGFAYFAGAGGFEYEYLLAAAAIALILCGPGLYSIDRNWGWARRPAWGSVAWLIIAIAAAVGVWVAFNGSNPFARH